MGAIKRPVPPPERKPITAQEKKEFREKHGGPEKEKARQRKIKESKRSPTEQERYNSLSPADKKKADKKFAGAADKAKLGKSVEEVAKEEAKKNIEFDDQAFFWDHIHLFENQDRGAAQAAASATLKLPAPTNLLAGERDRAAVAAFHNALKPFLYKNFLQIKDD